jgi:sugar lactone lactonase YvrE
MRGGPNRWWMLAALAAACAHAPPPPAAPGPAPVFPSEQLPRAQWTEALPRPAAPDDSIWSRLGRAILGVRAEERRPPALQRPFGVAVGEDGAVLWVADPDAPGLFRIDSGGVLEPVACRGREWGAPMAVAVSPDGTLWVADAGAPAVVRLARDRACQAFGAGDLMRPTGVAVAGGRVWVADPPAHRLVAFEPDGRVALRIGEEGGGPGQLEFPSGVGVDGAGNLLVVDALNFRISRFSPDGRFLSAFGERGDESGELARPKAVATDARGRIYVSDAQRDTILVYSDQGAFDYALGEPGSDPGQVVLPAGLAVSGDRVFVADSGNGRIEVYRLLGDAR